VNVVEYEPRDPASWNLQQMRTPAFVAGAELAALAEHDERIVVLTADLAYSNRTHEFAQRHPRRFINLGIAEQNMVSVAAGLASYGLRPYTATFASFIGLLCAEQIRTDLAFPHLPVRILAHHSGMALGFYGTSHHALEDIAFMRAIADLAVVSATDANMLRALLRFSLDFDGPLYIRMGRGRDPEVYEEPPGFRLGASYRLRDGADIAILATGAEVAPSLDAAEFLSRDGIEARVVDCVSLSPLDRDAVGAAARDCGALLTVEEHNVTGGLGSAVAEVLADQALAARFGRHGIHDLYPLVGPPAGLYAHYRLDAAGIAAVVRELLGDGD
jgi:transketolase